jgi:hypothetical protein
VSKGLVTYRAYGTADRPSGLWRSGIHIASWPAGVPVLNFTTAPVVAAWENIQGTRRPLTKDEVLALVQPVLRRAGVKA